MHTDYVVPYDPDKDTKEDLTLKIINALFVLPLKRKKPRIIFIGGQSGEGKSWAVLRFMELVAKVQGLDLKDWMDVCNVYTPLQYPEKLRSLLFDKKYKKVNMIAVHEARQLVRNTNWHTFLTQSIGDVNAMSRAIKRLCFFVVSQSMRDIAKEIRYTLNYYLVCHRPGKDNTRVRFYKIYLDERDLDNPKLKKRKVKGYLIYPDGTQRRHEPPYFSIRYPSKELRKKFDEDDRKAKGNILWDRLDKLVDGMEKDLKKDYSRINELVDFYKGNPESLLQFGKIKDEVFVANSNFVKHHGLKRGDKKQFELAINDAIGGMSDGAKE